MKTQDAIKYFGTASRLARALGIERQAVSAWGEKIPSGRQFQIEVITKGKLKAEKVAA